MYNNLHDDKRPKVMVLCGGPGSEHFISLQSGYQIFKHMDRSKFQPVMAMIDQVDIVANSTFEMVPKQGKQRIIFGDATHAVAAARIA